MKDHIINNTVAVSNTKNHKAVNKFGRLNPLKDNLTAYPNAQINSQSIVTI